MWYHTAKTNPKKKSQKFLKENTKYSNNDTRKTGEVCSLIERSHMIKDYVKRERHIATRFISEDESEKAAMKGSEGEE